MRRGRIAAAAALALLCAPGQWWRGAVVADASQAVRFFPLAAQTPEGWPAGLTLEQAWHLESANSQFAGFSALVLDGDGFRAFSDFGQVARFARPTSRTARVETHALPSSPQIAFTPDVEAAIFDSASGDLFLSYEYHNKLRRIDARGSSTFAHPRVLRGLGENSGVEAMARLSDGRFIMLAEVSGEGFVFAGDPVADPRASMFRVVWPGNYRPTDMAQLPDGRVLVLARSLTWGFPPVSSRLFVGDPVAIRAGRAWHLEPLATIDEPGLRENYEGLAVEQAADGATIIWLISDNNRAALQRTLMLKLRWTADKQTAREAKLIEAGPREP